MESAALFTPQGNHFTRRNSMIFYTMNGRQVDYFARKDIFGSQPGQIMQGSGTRPVALQDTVIPDFPLELFKGKRLV